MRNVELLTDSRLCDGEETLALLDSIRRASQSRVVESTAKLKGSSRNTFEVGSTGRMADSINIVGQLTLINTQKGGYLRRSHHLLCMSLYLGEQVG